MAEAPCRFCDNPVTVGKPGEYRLVEGLAMNREGGGAHGVTQLKDLHQYAHGFCLNGLEDKSRRYHGVFNCRYCGAESTGLTLGAAVVTRGWVLEREEGGAHAIQLRRDRVEGVCPDCMGKLLAGVNPNQESLL